MKLTEKQRDVIECLSAICKRNVLRYRKTDKYMHSYDKDKLIKGDSYCPFALGGLTSQIAHKTGFTAGYVLSAFKALERKGLVIREDNRGYLCALYWWPVGFSSVMLAEIELMDGQL